MLIMQYSALFVLQVTIAVVEDWIQGWVDLATLCKMLVVGGLGLVWIVVPV